MCSARSRRLSSLLITSGLILLGGATIRTANSAPGTQETSATVNKPAGEVFKNIQVLKDMPASQLGQAMDFMAASLGVACDFCHTSAMESDEKSTKLTTRQMIVMTAGINKQWFSGFAVVNCYTCHRGRTSPASVPEIADLTVRPDAGSIESSGALPSADLVISRYETAAGGVEAVDKLTSGLFIGSQTSYGPGRDPERAAIELYNKTPGKFLYNTRLAREPVRGGFDGKSGWVISGDGVRLLEGEDLLRTRHDCDLLQYLRLKQSFSGFRVLGREKLANRRAIVVGAVARDGTRAKLYFDESVGLLLRWAGQIKTPYGTLPDVIDLEDYRKVAGVKVPFRIKRSRPPVTVVQELNEVRVNVPIEDSRFAPPPR